MGSRVMHYCISSIIANECGLTQKHEFLLGGIAPDIHGMMGVSKGVTHFKDKGKDGKGFINFRRFYEQYKDKMDEPFYIGYLCHLISDAVWNDFYTQKIPYISKEQWIKQHQATYRDYRRLNGRIIKQYSLELLPLTIPGIHIEGYNEDYLPELIELMSDDFVINEELTNEPLELFENSEIVDYLDQSVNRSLRFLRSNQIITKS